MLRVSYDPVRQILYLISILGRPQRISSHLYPCASPVDLILISWISWLSIPPIITSISSLLNGVPSGLSTQPPSGLPKSISISWHTKRVLPRESYLECHVKSHIRITQMQPYSISHTHHLSLCLNEVLGFHFSSHLFFLSIPIPHLTHHIKIILGYIQNTYLYHHIKLH